MRNIGFLSIFLFFSGCYFALEVKANCSFLENFEGKYSRELNTGSYTRNKSECWTIKAKPGYFMIVNITDILSNTDCSSAYIEISKADSVSKYVFCQSRLPSYPLMLWSGNTITANVKNVNYYYNSYYIRYTLQYAMKSVICMEENRFECDNHTCINKHQVCDGVQDCSNGADENGCETGVLSVDGVEEARKAVVSWLQKQRTAPWGWKANTPRAVVALRLSGAARFNGTNASEEVIAKDAELKTSLELIKPSLTNSELAMFVHSLLVICHNPKHFYGHNLVERLSHQMELNTNFTHPVAYLALCNSNQSWPDNAIDDLSYVLESDSTYPFFRDIQAMAVMAVSCQDKIKNGDMSFNSSLLILVNDTIKRLKAFQQDDGSFGNVHTTALIVQALMSSGYENSKDWNMKKSIKYLIRELNSSSVDFLSVYLTLPILNGKTLVDISKINCSSNPRTKDDNPVSELDKFLGNRIRVQYSLIIGDHMDVVFTMYLRVPEKYTAFQLMTLAAAQDAKYKFLWKNVSQQKYVYEMANITNDPEAGKFWLLHIATNSSEPPQHLDANPDEVILKNKDHLVMWFKTAHL